MCPRETLPETKLYKADAAVQKICEVEGGGAVNKRIALIMLQQFINEDKNNEDLSRSARPAYGVLRIPLQICIKIHYQHKQLFTTTWSFERYSTPAHQNSQKVA